MESLHRSRPARHPRPTVPGSALILVVLLAACGGGETSQPANASDRADASEPAGESTQVDIEGLNFGTSELTVQAGTVVTFTNLDSVPHTVTHGSDGVATDGAVFDEQLPGGAEVTITFDEPGTYPITCTIHPSMNMTVVVEG